MDTHTHNALTVTQLASRLRCGTWVVKQWIKQGCPCTYRQRGFRKFVSLSWQDVCAWLMDTGRCSGEDAGEALLTKSELAASLNVSADTVRNWAKRGCPHISASAGDKDFLRFDPAAVQKWMNERRGARADAPGAVDADTGRTADLLTLDEVAERLDVSPRTVSKWRVLGCPCVSLGRSVSGKGSRPRFSLADVVAWKKRREEERMTRQDGKGVEQ